MENISSRLAVAKAKVQFIEANYRTKATTVLSSNKYPGKELLQDHKPVFAEKQVQKVKRANYHLSDYPHVCWSALLVVYLFCIFSKPIAVRVIHCRTSSCLRKFLSSIRVRLRKRTGKDWGDCPNICLLLVLCCCLIRKRIRTMSMLLLIICWVLMLRLMLTRRKTVWLMLPLLC